MRGGGGHARERWRVVRGWTVLQGPDPQGGLCCRVWSGAGPRQRVGWGAVRGRGWGLWVGSGAKAGALPSPALQLHGGQPGWHSPKPPACAPEGPRAPSVAPAKRGRPQEAPSCPQGSSISAFWKHPPLPSLSSQDRSSAVAGGETWRWWAEPRPEVPGLSSRGIHLAPS